ncbi:MAG: sulfatase-like hydrolase/transferase [bacterium]|nr:sulfatase-like hydrolase/transferase [bacterium]
MSHLKKFIISSTAPILISISPILYLFAENFDRMSAIEIWIPICISIFIVFIVSGGLTLFSKNFEKAAIITSFWIVYFYLFLPISKFLFKLDFVNNKGIAAGITFYLGTSALLCFTFWCISTRRKVDWIGSFLKVGSISLILMVIISITNKSITTEMEISSIGPEIDLNQSNPKLKPDIYYILLDGFGRFDVLNQMYGVSTENFNQKLKDLGFYVATDSKANYIQTLLSLSSTLNMDYLDKVTAKLPKDSKDRSLIRSLVRNSKVMNFLTSNGYTSYSFASGYSGTDLIKTDQRVAAPYVFSEFHNLIFNVTPLPNLFRKLGLFKWQYDSHRKRLNFIFTELPKIGEKITPKFVFAHIMAPHPPFVFDSKGQENFRKRNFAFDDGSHFKGKKREYLAGYRGQVTFLMNKISNIVEEILKRDPDAIIILQGDHGPGSELNWSSVSQSNLWERTAILNAFRMGSNWPENLSMRSDISPVNTFRLILKEIFKLEIAELPDKSFYSTWKKPYEFIEVEN